MRLTLALGAILTLALAACGGDDNPKQDDSCGAEPSCAGPLDCALGFTCNADGCCEEFGCTPGSCDAGQFCDDDLACRSVADKCSFEACECAIINAANELEASGDPMITLAPGATFELRAVLAVSNGTQLPISQTEVSWAGGTSFDDAFSLTGVALEAKSIAMTGSSTVTATINGVTCSADVVNLGDPADLRFFVMDDSSALPVSGAIVVVDSDNDGIADAELTTDSSGLATSAVDTSGGPFTVSVFKGGYNYLSVVGVAASVTDLVLPITARPQGPAVTGGFNGTLDFSQYEKVVLGKEKTYQLGVVASSFPLKAVLNFDLDLILGNIASDCTSEADPGCYRVDLDPLFNDFAPLPGGLTLALKSRPIKPFFDVVASAGRRYAWGLGAQVELRDITGIVDAVAPLLEDDAGATSIDFGLVFDSLVPLLSSFGSGLQGNIPLEPVSIETWDSYIAADYDARSANASFPQLDSSNNDGFPSLSPGQPMRQFSEVIVPDLPVDPSSTEGYQMEGVVFLSGISSPGYGFVPLGLGAGLDCTEADGACVDRGANPSAFNGRVNGGQVCVDIESCPAGAPLTVDEGRLGLWRAPAHSGLQGQEWVNVALALPISGLLDGGDITATAFIKRGEPSATEDLSSTAFAPFPDKGTSTGTNYTISNTSGIDVHWVTVAAAVPNGADDATQRWNVYVANGTTEFKAPGLPAGLSGCDYNANGNAGECVDPFVENAGGDLDVTHVGFDFDPGLCSWLGAGVDGLVSNNGRSVNDLFGCLNAFSVRNSKVATN